MSTAFSTPSSTPGSARLAFVQRGTTQLAELFQQAPLRVLRPRVPPGEPPCAVLVNTSGGIVGGDALRVAARLEAGGSAVITSQTAEASIANLGIGRKFQKPTVFENLSVIENLELALENDRHTFRTLLVRLSGQQSRRIDEVLGTIGLGDHKQALAARSRTARSSGSRSACCWCRTRNCCCSTSRSPG